MAFTFCTSGAMVYKAGPYANANIVISGALLTEWSNEVEGQIAIRTGMDFITNYSTLNTELKRGLQDLASDLGAMKIISADMTGFSLKVIPQTMLDVYRDNANQIITDLKDLKNKKIETVVP